MSHFVLTVKERSALWAIKQTTQDVRICCRAQALLWLDLGDSVEDIAERLDVTRQTIYHWVMIFRQRATWDMAQRLADAPRSGRPRTALGVIDPLIDAVIDADPRAWGYRATTWTAALLVEYLWQTHHLNVSVPSVKLAIRRLRIRWKRPRHALALRPATWRQAKGGLNTGCLPRPVAWY